MRELQLKATLPVQFIASQLCALGDASCIACTNQGGFFVEAQGLADSSLGPLFAQVLKCFNPNGAPFGTYAGTLTTTAPNGKDALTWAYSGKNDNAGDFYGFQPFSGTLTTPSRAGRESSPVRTGCAELYSGGAAYIHGGAESHSTRRNSVLLRPGTTRTNQR